MLALRNWKFGSVSSEIVSEIVPAAVSATRNVSPGSLRGRTDALPGEVVLLRGAGESSLTRCFLGPRIGPKAIIKAPPCSVRLIVARRMLLTVAYEKTSSKVNPIVLRDSSFFSEGGCLLDSGSPNM
jgi:hypothetical protein